MPDLTESNVRHLLRRTEFVDTPERVSQLLGSGSIEAAVDDVMNVDPNPPSASFDGIGNDWERGSRLAAHWMDRMARAPRPFAERMAFFWHGHICTEIGKAGNAEVMRQQVDLFRRTGLGTAAAPGNVVRLMKDMSIQPAMLRYLDNDKNVEESPNQNFARELMELFVLGVGNYTEADVEASTAAWTGHTVGWQDNIYRFEADDHESAPQTFLGRTINAGAVAPNLAGAETIDVMLGTGVVPPAAAINAGRPTREVAAEFLSKKLWQEFGEAVTPGPSLGAGRVGAAMRSALVDSGFDIRHWVRTMLTHPDFYPDANPAVVGGLVRQPVEYAIALMVATGLSAEAAAPRWLMSRTGQELLAPPNVSGWRPNGYFVNAAAMEARSYIGQACIWRLTESTWDGDAGYVDLPGGRITKSHLRNDSDAAFVTRMQDALRLRFSQATIDRIVAHVADPVIEWWHRLDALMLMLIAPEMHVA